MFRKKFYKGFLSGALAITMLLSSSSSFAFAKAPKTPKVPNVKSQKTTIKKTEVKNVTGTLTQYDINSKFDEANKTFTCSETVKFTNTYGKALNSLVFHLYPDSYGDVNTLSFLAKKEKLEKDEIGDINITKVTIANKTMNFTQDNQVLKLTSVSNIKPNETIEVKIDFTLKLPKSLNRLGYYNDVYSVTNWYPIISMYDTKTDKWDENPFHPVGESNYSDIANYKASITVPEKMVLASSGTTLSDKKDKNGTRTYNITAENVRDFVFIMSPSFKVLTKKLGDITVNTFYLADNNAQTTQYASSILDLGIEALKFFGDSFGKYPYKEFDIVETHVQGFAMEYPQLIQMGKFNPPSNGQRSFLEEAIVHEIAHQWWYVTVGSNEFKESFLDESLTAFSTAYFFDKREGKYSPAGTTLDLRNMMDYFKCSTPIYVPVTEIQPREWGKLVYKMGALVVEDLRQKVGEDKFLKIMQTYYSRNKLKNATLDGLLSVIEEIGGKEARDLVYTSVTSKDYYPKHLALNETELKEYKKIKVEEIKETRENIKGWIERFKQDNVNNFSSFIVNALNNYDVYLVKPSNSKMSEEVKKSFDNEVNIFKNILENGFGVNVIVKEDKDMTENELKENSLIFLGDNIENSALKSVVDKMPIDFSKDEIRFNDVSVKNSNISGIIVADASKNKNNSVLIVLRMDKEGTSSILNGNDFYDKQFILNFGNKILKGNYDK